MKTVNVAVKNALRQDYVINAQPRLTIEWNFNRYLGVSADNTPSEATDGYDVEQFPIESLYAPNRPTRGVCKARVNEARVSTYTAGNVDTRYYTAGVTDQYKYWTSPVPTNASAVFPNHTDGQSKCRPAVSYDTLLGANKIVINWENSWAQPNSYFVYIQTTVGGAWTQLTGSSFTINSKGQTILYHQGSDVWTTTRPVDGNGKLVTNFKNLAGVMVKVNSMTAGAGNHPGTGANAYCSVIEISARREEDFTSRLVTVEDTFDMGDTSIIYPMGTLTTNTGSVSLDNTDGVLAKDSASTYLRWLVEPGAIFNLEYVYTVAGTRYVVQQFSMYGGPWMGQRDDTVTIELNDFSQYLREARPNACFFEGLPVTQIIWRLCDQVGFVNYNIDSADLAAVHVIPYFWADGEKTVWELFDELSKASQTAIYFDSYGVLQVKTRETAFESAATPVWTLRGEKSGAELADIVELNQSDELQTNHVTVNYQTTSISDDNNGFPKLDSVWSAEDTVTLRSTNLTRSMTSSETTYLWINEKEAVYWPYSGVVQVEGEFIRYKAKNYMYYNAGVRTGANITSADEKAALDKKTFSSQLQLNHFTGALLIDNGATDEGTDPGFPGRGLWNTNRAAHSVDISGYQGRSRHPGSATTLATSFYQDKQNSTLVIDTGPKFPHYYDLYAVTRGSTLDQGYYYYGTKMKFEAAGKPVNRAGIVIHSGANEDGYYIELTPSKFLTPAGRKYSNEVTLFSRKTDAVNKISSYPLAIVEGVWYEVDVSWSTSGGVDTVTVFVNGVQILSSNISGGNINAWQGRFGMFVRGQSKVSFEYLYAIGTQETQPLDGTGVYNRIEGGYQGQLDREWTYQYRTNWYKPKKYYVPYKQKFAQRVIDEFGPIVHEVREYDVKFDPKPVLHSQLYMTNDWGIICPEYTSTPFGAKFLLANVSRDNQIVNGEDNLTYIDNTINQVLAVYGRLITQAEAQSTIAKNDSQIRRRGRIDSELTSPWIQSEAMAKDIADWMVNHWAEAADIQDVEVFGNPLFEVTDVVNVSYAAKSMDTVNYVYYVTGIRTSWDNGLTTQLTLRRVRS